MRAPALRDSVQLGLPLLDHAGGQCRALGRQGDRRARRLPRSPPRCQTPRKSRFTGSPASPAAPAVQPRKPERATAHTWLDAALRRGRPSHRQVGTVHRPCDDRPAGLCACCGPLDASGVEQAPAESAGQGCFAWRGDALLDAGACAMGLSALLDFRNAGGIQRCHARDENAGGSPKWGAGRKTEDQHVGLPPWAKRRNRATLRSMNVLATGNLAMRGVRCGDRSGGLPCGRWAVPALVTALATSLSAAASAITTALRLTPGAAA